MFSFSKIISAISRSIFPSRCVLCGVFDTWLCSSCLQTIPLHPVECPICRRTNNGFIVHDACQAQTELHRLIIGAPLTHPAVEGLIHQLKYEYLESSYDAVAAILLRAFQSLPRRIDSVIVPIPLHSRRRRERGFNQSALIGKALSKTLSIPYIELLERTRYTTTQTKLSRMQRRDNLTGAFSISKRIRIPVTTTIFLIDDITTTLSTFNEAASSLRKEGYASIWGVAVARGSFKASEKLIDKTEIKRYKNEDGEHFVDHSERTVR